MKAIAPENVVMTHLWKIASDKSLNCLLGDMESCENEEIIIGDTNNNEDFVDTSSEAKISKIFDINLANICIKKHDYQDYLVNNVHEMNSSDYDTDDLIEDAKNFVTASKTRLVDSEVWKEIDETRRKKRLSRKERNSKLKQMNENESPISLPFVPKCVNDLKVGFNVRVISNSGQVGNAVVK